MAGYLQTILAIDEPIFSVGMKALEKSTGNSGIDSKLVADIHEKAHHIMRVLGLDTGDTTGRELYHSLVAAVKNNNIEELLYESDYVVYLHDNDVISFNLIDVVENSHHELSYESRAIGHGQRSLRGEIIKRYIEHARTNETTTKQLAASIGLMPESDAWYNNNANT
jgi:hypothetical protein